MLPFIVSLRPGLAGVVFLLLLAGCAPEPHRMGDPLAGLGVKPAPARAAGLRALAHKDVALVLSANTLAVRHAVSVSNGAAIMFDEGALPKSASHDFAAQLETARAELFKDRLGKVTEVSSLDGADGKGPGAAAILDLQVYDSSPAASGRGYSFRARLTVYFVDIRSRERLGEISVSQVLKLSPAELQGEEQAVIERKNRLLAQTLAQTFFALAGEMDARLGTTPRPAVLPVAAAPAGPGAAPAGPAEAPQARAARPAKNSRQLVMLAKKLRELEALHAYGFISDTEYDARKRGLLRKYGS